ncbi:hypothetical protein I2W78_07800 [Streptomyces spinoverrucosus]|uniref:hypothetical protein n=1 Tax=Streptomyces spinoverrucosus TaxID=284043 RepID=UPI0018C35E2C|nr:hypothetical protein [Streptomyces spinoverrucosus]MBG0851749.1 hypothetical protein [Streptomyces spinoverrucosus]
MRMTWTADDDWFFAVDQARPVTVGPDGPGRPSASDVAGLLRRLLVGPWIDVDADWRIEAHRLQTVVPVGEPVRARLPRWDDCEFLLLAVIRQEGARGGGPRLVPAGATDPCWTADLPPGRALLIDCRTVNPDVHHLHATGPGPGVQDLLVAVLTRERATRVPAA